MNRTSLVVALIVPSLLGACGAGENTVGTEWPDAGPGDTQTSNASDACSDCSSGSAKLSLSIVEACLSAPVGKQSASQAFDVTNIGTGASGALTITLSGNDAASFAIVSNTCTGSTLAPDAKCSVAVIYAPTAAPANAQGATLTVTDGQTSVEALVRGGVIGTVTLSPAALDFGEVAAGSTSGELLVRVTTTSHCWTMLTAVVENPNFVIASDTCTGHTTNACQIGVRLAPAADATPSSITGQLTITASDSGAASVALSGVITGATPQTEPLYFGEVILGQSYTVDFSFTVGNPSSEVLLTGSGAAQFSIASMTAGGTCTTPGATCTIQVKFAPVVLGLSTANLIITHGKGTETLTFNLSGKGVDAPVAAQFSVMPTVIAFGKVPVGTTSSPLMITVTTASARTFTATLSDNAASEMAIVKDTCTGSLIPAGGTCTISVTHTPTKIGNLNGTLNISDGTDVVAVTLAGESGTLP